MCHFLVFIPYRESCIADLVREVLSLVLSPYARGFIIAYNVQAHGSAAVRRDVMRDL